MRHDVVVANISGFIRRETHWQDDPSLLTSDYPLLDSGLIDSVTIVKLVVYLEKNFGTVIRDEDLLPENFADIDAVAKLIGERRGG